MSNYTLGRKLRALFILRHTSEEFGEVLENTPELLSVKIEGTYYSVKRTVFADVGTTLYIVKNDSRDLMAYVVDDLNNLKETDFAPISPDSAKFWKRTT